MCGCSTVRGGGPATQSACARLCRRHSERRVCLPPRPGTCNGCVLQRSRHQAPTAGASLRLLHGARRTRTQGAFARLCRRHMEWSSACQHRPDTCNVSSNGAAIKLRLLEELACGCSTVRGQLTKSVLVCAAGTRGGVVAAITPRHLHGLFFVTVPPSSSD